MAAKLGKYSCFITSLLVFSVILTSCQGFSDQIFERTQTGYYYGKGLNNIEEMKFRRAITSLSEGLKDYRNSGLLTLRGFAFCKTGKFQDAVDDFSLALKYRQTEEYNIASINRHLSKTAYFKEPFIYANRGLAYSYLTDFEKASEDIKKAVELEPDVSIWYCYSALNKVNMKNYDQALVDLNKAINLDRKNAVAFHIRAQVYEKLDDKDMAQQDLETEHSLGYKLAGDITKYSIKIHHHI